MVAFKHGAERRIPLATRQGDGAFGALISHSLGERLG